VQLAPQQQLEQQQQQQHTRHHTVTAAAASPPERAAAGSAPKSKLAVFVSGGGSNFKAIHAACLSGAINADVVVRGEEGAEAQLARGCDAQLLQLPRSSSRHY
jgi:phosphoribosylglycinamide formyltransferase